MRLLTCLVTHDRAEYTRRCFDSWMETADPDDNLIVIDNASTDGTKEVFRFFDHVFYSDTNSFPGAACNQGWTEGLKLWPETTHLHRSDNDIFYRPGWREEVESAYDRNPNLALLGILNLHEDNGFEYPPGDPGDIDFPGAVGGNVVMPRELWDKGLRWQEGVWRPGANEDALMSSAAASHGEVGRLVRTVADNMAYGRYIDYPDYYDVTAALRGLPDATTSV